MLSKRLLWSRTGVRGCQTLFPKKQFLRQRRALWHPGFTGKSWIKHVMFQENTLSPFSFEARSSTTAPAHSSALRQERLCALVNASVRRWTGDWARPSVSFFCCFPCLNTLDKTFRIRSCFYGVFWGEGNTQKRSTTLYSQTGLLLCWQRVSLKKIHLPDRFPLQSTSHLWDRCLFIMESGTSVRMRFIWFFLVAHGSDGDDHLKQTCLLILGFPIGGGTQVLVSYHAQHHEAKIARKHQFVSRTNRNTHIWHIIYIIYIIYI